MITSPTLLLDKKKCLANIGRMAAKADRHGLVFKPHFKTHQSAQIGAWFRDFGVTAITVSSIDMAQYFAGHGWDDITIAFPANIREMERIAKLAKRLKLSLLVNSIETATYLDTHLTHPVTVYIEVDTGDGRSGIDPADTKQIETLIMMFDTSQILNFKGFYSHPGHSYSARSKEEVNAIHDKACSIMQALKNRFQDSGSITCCLGDTPCCSVAEHFEGVDEISPGNFVFYDLMQNRIGSCAISDIAVALAAPVVARQKERNELIIHGGAVHLSKEFIRWNGIKSYGLPVRLSGSEWSEPVADSHLTSLSQEHGILRCSEHLFSSLKIGDLIGILPVHSCLTANLMNDYLLCEEITP